MRARAAPTSDPVFPRRSLPKVRSGSQLWLGRLLPHRPWPNSCPRFDLFRCRSGDLRNGRLALCLHFSGVLQHRDGRPSCSLYRGAVARVEARWGRSVGRIPQVLSVHAEPFLPGPAVPGHLRNYTELGSGLHTHVLSVHGNRVYVRPPHLFQNCRIRDRLHMWGIPRRQNVRVESRSWQNIHRSILGAVQHPSRSFYIFVCSPAARTLASVCRAALLPGAPTLVLCRLQPTHLNGAGAARLHSLRRGVDELHRAPQWVHLRPCGCRHALRTLV
mmetsp:Transcript_13861/g.30569  ORF Transcript_13861/g.30569 Transcript_13861/m.30569 type:complete len:274 (-) Transcript_13861:544-1365(-)